MPRIPIEQKHTYNSMQRTLYGTYVANRLIGDTVVWQQLTYPVLGTDEDERIGRKIQTDYISYETYYQLQTNYSLQNALGNFYDKYLDAEAQAYNDVADDEEGAPLDPIDGMRNSLQSPIDLTFREFIVEFEPDAFDITDEEATQTYLLNWYQALVVLTGPNIVSSNRQQIKRESTLFTGTFRILKDKLHHVSFQKQMVHDFGTIDYKRNLNFAEADQPTQGIFLRFWIGPQNCIVDYGNLAFGIFLQSGEVNDQVAVLNINSTMKLSYSDV